MFGNHGASPRGAEAGKAGVVAEARAGDEGKTPSQKHVQQQRFKETIQINHSLFVLRKVIVALANGGKERASLQHIPFRESKLT